MYRFFFVHISFNIEVSSTRDTKGTNMRIGIIGAGAIAQFLIEQLNEQQVGRFVVTSLFVRSKEKYELLADKFNVTLYTEVREFLQSGIDVVVEAATIEAVQELMPIVLTKKPAVLISVGALAEASLRQQLLALTLQHKLYLPSGAIGGLDFIQNAAALGTLSNVSLSTRKPAPSLLEEPISEAKVIFQGTAAEAITLFPKNMNVSIVLALAGLGFEQTMVEVIADPHITQNIHVITASGDFGEVTIQVKNNPLPTNPKTSYLAAMSIIGTLKRLDQSLVIGG